MTTRTPDGRDVLERLAKYCDEQMPNKPVTWNDLSEVFRYQDEFAALPEPGAAGETKFTYAQIDARDKAIADAAFERGFIEGIRNSAGFAGCSSFGEMGRRIREDLLARAADPSIIYNSPLRQRASQEG